MSDRSPPSLLFLLAMIGLGGLGEFIYSPSIVEVAQSFSASVELTQITVSINLVGFACGTFLFGLLADRYGCRAAYFVGLACYSLGALLCLISPQLWVLVGARAIQGFGSGCGGVIARSVIRSTYSKTEQKRIGAYAVAVLSVSPMLGPVLGGVITQHFGWRANFGLLFALSGIMAMAARSRLSDPHAPDPGALELAALPRRIFDVLRRPAFSVHVLVGGLLTGISVCFQITAPFLLIGELGLSESVFGLWQLPVALAFLMGSSFAGRVLATWPGRRIIFSGLLPMLALALGAFFVSATFELSALSVVVPMALMTIGIGVAKSQTATMAMLSLEERTGLGSAVLGMSQMLLAATLAMALSLLEIQSQRGMTTLFVALAAGLVVVYGVFMALGREPERGPAV